MFITIFPFGINHRNSLTSEKKLIQSEKFFIYDMQK